MSSPHPVLRAVMTATATAAMLMALVAGGVSPAHAADPCPNAAVRAHTDSTELPQCRAYETVTPIYREGFGFTPQVAAVDGNAFSFVSTGNFADNPNGQPASQYVAARAATGWTTIAHNPPADRYDVRIAFGAEALSADLSRSLWMMKASSDADLNYYLREPGGSFARIGQGSVPGVSPGPPFTLATSPDLSHVVFAHGGTGSGSPADAALWEFVGTGNTGLPRAVSVTNNGQLMASKTCFQEISTDARVIVFASECFGGVPQPLWARVGGSATVRVSGSECTRDPTDLGGPCNASASAAYGGMAKDGSRVFFTTTQQLVNTDTDATSDLYACDIPPGAPTPVATANPCTTLTRVSDTDGARVEDVVAVSDDGSQAYFIAQGVLADNIGTNNAPPANDDHNLYLWTKTAAHPTGQIRFVARLDTPELRNPQMTPDDRYLAFNTTTQLITNGPGADIDAMADVYRYDAQTEAMVRLSSATSGTGGNGPYGASSSMMSADGSMIVFETDEALSLTDSNAGSDVYLWHDGQVSSISGAAGGGSQPRITPSGHDVFFATDQAPSGDFYGHVYDARIDGGFDRPAVVPCANDDCQGPQSAPPPLARPAPANLADPATTDAPPVLSLRAVSVTQRRRLAATGKLTLTVITNTSGTIRATATAVLAGRTTTIASARQTNSEPGTTHMTLTLAKKARARLAAHGSLTIRIAVSHSRIALNRTATLRLTKPKTKTAKTGKNGGRS